MMQTLKLFGIPVIGGKDYAHFYEQKEYHDMNPKGFYELGATRGKKKIDFDDPQFNGKAIKLFGVSLVWVPAKRVEKLIICMRNVADALGSYKKYQKYLAPGSDSDLFKRHDVNLYAAWLYVQKYKVPNIIVEYEDMLRKTRKTIKRLRKFLGIQRDVTEAVKNVDQKDNRKQLEL